LWCAVLCGGGAFVFGRDLFFFVTVTELGEQGPMVLTEPKCERASKCSQENGRERRYDLKKK